MSCNYSTLQKTNVSFVILISRKKISKSTYSLWKNLMLKVRIINSEKQLR